MLILFLFSSAAWAFNSTDTRSLTNTGTLIDFTGQGIPRETLEDCHSAAAKLTDFLSKKGFKNISTDCVGTSAEIGGLVPTLAARNTYRYKTEQLMNGPLPDAAACDKALTALLASVHANSVMESACLQGTDQDFQGRKTIYFQPWVTTLTKIVDPTTAASVNSSKGIERDLRDNKAVSATLGTTKKSAAPADGKTKAK